MHTLIERLEKVTNSKELEEARLNALGKKGVFADKFNQLKNLNGEEKNAFAKEIHHYKQAFEKAFELKKKAVLEFELEERLKKEKIDVSLFNAIKTSSSHPLNHTKNKIIEFFTPLGYKLEIGSLVEDDFHNFSALNLPPYHPARDMQDTFYFKDHKLLRTHTSPVQIHTMQEQTPPIKMICLGETFRRDYDLTHTPMFHQIEGLVVDQKGNIRFTHLKGVIEDFLHYFFGGVQLRWRSSFFPFTEPSAEVDISCVFCKQEGCRVCSHTGWLEVLGCGMVNNAVFEAVGYENVSGFAFGMGIERLAMLTCQINDLRSFFETDLRVLESF
ncbi:phenylalanine--tRNA ligase subunit alpha [Helicobacter pylori]|uniref:phenylalanine--tRNA ligase subunit alpha n=1 Tax=Helicobacter pylori TaxID=210 RepID=UPI0015DA92DE|nr:phenylalanine--tRNA ligase subunit alpha [Helicobacter pylori]UOR64568.1 phenylalanine--tRNA ligase subunit alpha [Helicobacter pylori]WQZ41098.1 phenylalanine--tRNA ligase subunit alpha [Helicobacter pylori]